MYEWVVIYNIKMTYEKYMHALKIRIKQKLYKIFPLEDKIHV